MCAFVCLFVCVSARVQRSAAPPVRPPCSRATRSLPLPQLTPRAADAPAQTRLHFSGQHRETAVLWPQSPGALIKTLGPCRNQREGKGRRGQGRGGGRATSGICNTHSQQPSAHPAPKTNMHPLKYTLILSPSVTLSHKNTTTTHPGYLLNLEWTCVRRRGTSAGQEAQCSRAAGWTVGPWHQNKPLTAIVPG